MEERWTDGLFFSLGFLDDFARHTQRRDGEGMVGNLVSSTESNLS